MVRLVPRKQSRCRVIYLYLPGWCRRSIGELGLSHGVGNPHDVCFSPVPWATLNSPQFGKVIACLRWFRGNSVT